MLSNFFKHIQNDELDVTNVSIAVFDVRIVNSIIILGLNCKPLIASNVSKLKYFKYVENKDLY